MIPRSGMLAAISLLLVMFPPAGRAAAPISGSSGSASTSANGPVAAKLLVAAARRLHPALWATGTQIPSTPAGTDSFYEITASVEGRMSCGGQDMLLLKMNGATLDVLAPHVLAPNWMDEGATLRLIVKDNPQTGATQGLSAAAGYAIVAVAPETEVYALEKPYLPVLLRPNTLSSQHSVSRGAYRVSFIRRSPASSYNFAGLAPGRPICNLAPQYLAVYPAYRAQILRINPRLDDSMLDRITSSVLGYSSYYKLDPRLIMAMIVAESGFDPDAVSRSGATGLGQLMPETAAGLGVDPHDPVMNIGAAVRILSTRVQQYGGTGAQGVIPMNTLLLTMASYNAGAGAVSRYHGVPPYRETQAYVRKVEALYRRMCGD